MNIEYVEKRDEGYWISGSRVSLASIVYAFLNGQTAESIAQSFPTLSLEQVYGAITYYLAHRSEIDAYLRETDRTYEAQRAADPMFYKKLADARHISREPGLITGFTGSSQVHTFWQWEGGRLKGFSPYLLNSSSL